MALVNQINNKQTLNFLTDEGLLPNYAFPEAGITLRSVLWRRKEGGEAREYQNTTFEYERPASTALAELAPLNNFYAGGHKVEIEQIDLKVSEPENWRICSHCNYSENIDQTGDQHKYCPKCGTPGWADAGQNHAAETSPFMPAPAHVIARSATRATAVNLLSSSVSYWLVSKRRCIGGIRD